MFGAYFGLTAAKVLGAPHDPSGLEGSSITSDLLSLVGTVFLWLYWPSFNAGALTGNTDEAARATTNTIIGLLASCVACFITSGTISGKFSPADIQNATLAGGVAVGAVARMDIGLGWASIIGAAGGAISTLGYQFVQPFLQAKIGLHDSCGVHNLHGMPALFGGLISIIFVETNRDPGLANDAGKAAGMQGAALGVTIVISLVAGAITGFIMRVVKEIMKAKFYVPPPGQENLDKSVHFTDDRYWNVAPGSSAPDDKVTV